MASPPVSLCKTLVSTWWALGGRQSDMRGSPKLKLPAGSHWSGAGATLLVVLSHRMFCGCVSFRP